MFFKYSLLLPVSLLSLSLPLPALSSSVCPLEEEDAGVGQLLPPRVAPETNEFLTPEVLSLKAFRSLIQDNPDLIENNKSNQQLMLRLYFEGKLYVSNEKIKELIPDLKERCFDSLENPLHKSCFLGQFLFWSSKRGIYSH